MDNPAADKAALEQCLEIYRMQDDDSRRQIEAKLREETWFDVACFAAYCVQSTNLNLKPWQNPPAVVSADDEDEADKDAQRLLRRMQKYGVSRYVPDPMTAIAAARRNARQPA